MEKEIKMIDELNEVIKQICLDLRDINHIIGREDVNKKADEGREYEK